MQAKLPDYEFWRVRSDKLFSRKFNLTADESGLSLGNPCQSDCEESYKNGGNGCYSAIVGIKPIEPARKLTHGELILIWLLMLSPFLAGIPAGWLVYDVYRNTKTIDKP